MAIVATQNPGTAGSTPSVAAASAGGDKVSPDTRLHVINGGGASINVTIATPGVVDGTLLVDNRVIAVPNGAFPANSKSIDLPGRLYRNPTDGLVDLTWSGTTSVTFWVEGPVTQ